MNTCGPYPFVSGLPQINEWNTFVSVHDQQAAKGGMPTDYRQRKMFLSKLPWKNNKKSEVNEVKGDPGRGKIGIAGVSAVG